jgi:predicted dehydrogenase
MRNEKGGVAMRTRWAVWGSGGIARRRTIPEGITKAGNADLVAVYDVDGSVNREVAGEFGVVACESEEELLSSECDVIYVATPVEFHREQVIRATEEKRHVFCEKPLALNATEAERMLAACRDNNVKLGVGFMMRFHAYHLEALRLLKEGRIGIPVFGRAQLSCSYPPIEGAWRQNPARGGGGSLMDMGSHCIDLLEMFFGKTRKVSCFVGNRVHDYPSEDTVVAMLEFESGAKGVVDNLFNVPDQSSRNRLELYGSRGSILAEGTIGQGQEGDMVATFQESDESYDVEQTRSCKEGVRIVPTPVNMYRAEVEAFSRAVIEAKKPPVDGQAGLWNLRVIEACYESARTGQAVSL